VDGLQFSGKLESCSASGVCEPLGGGQRISYNGTGVFFQGYSYTQSDGTFNFETTAERAGEGWTIQARYDGGTVEDVAENVVKYMPSVSNIQTFSTIGEVGQKSPPSSAPKAIDITNETIANTPLQLQLQGQNNDTDANLLASIVSQPSNGSLNEIDQSTGIVTYTPNPGFTGQDRFKYTVSNGPLTSEPATVTITVSPGTSRQPPQAMDLTEETAANTPKPIRLQGQDDDPNADLTASIVSGPSNGQLDEIDQSTAMVTYTPDPDYTGPDQFTYLVNDGTSDSAPATVTIAVVNPAIEPLPCEEGTSLNETSEECVPIEPPVCEGGTVPDELGQCPMPTSPVTNGCEEGTTLNETSGECVPIEPTICEDGSAPDDLGQCPMPTSPVTNGCEEGTTLNETSGECVPIEPPAVCEEGTAINEETGECVPIEPTICEDGSAPDDLGQCPMPTSPVTNGCEEGTTLNETSGECVPIEPPAVCEEGTAINEETGECVPIEPTICEDGSAPDDLGQCPMPTSPVTNGCEEGTTLNETSGECVPVVENPVITCDDGSAPDELGQCVLENHSDM
jgi:hypothetical protein